MSRICDICKRGPRVGQTRSHSNIATKRWQRINIQAKKINGKRMNICSRCLKARMKKV